MDYLLFIKSHLHLYLISDIEFVKQFYPHRVFEAGKVKYQVLFSLHQSEASNQVT